MSVAGSSERFKNFRKIARLYDQALRAQREEMEWGSQEYQKHSSIRIYLEDYDDETLALNYPAEPENLVVPKAYAGEVAAGMGSLSQNSVYVCEEEKLLRRSGYGENLEEYEHGCWFEDLCTPLDFVKSLSSAHRNGIDIYVMDMDDVVSKAQNKDQYLVDRTSRKENAEHLVNDLKEIAENLETGAGAYWEELIDLDGETAVIVRKKGEHRQASELGEGVWTMPTSMPWRMLEGGS